MTTPPKPASALAASALAPDRRSSGASAEAVVGPVVEYKVVDQQWSPSDSAAVESMLDTQGGDGWRLVTVYLDPVRERTRWIFTR